MKKKVMNFAFAILMLTTLVFSTNVFASDNCPLGPNVTKDLYGALKIIRIVGPLLMIALTAVDAVKAIGSPDGFGAEVKKVYKKLLKRLVYVVLLFFVPLLVNQVMILTDVWGAGGICDLENPEQNSNAKEPLTYDLYRFKYSCAASNTNCTQNTRLDVRIENGKCTVNLVYDDNGTNNVLGSWVDVDDKYIDACNAENFMIGSVNVTNGGTTISMERQLSIKASSVD